MVLGPVFAGGVMLGCKALDEGGELEFGHLFAGFKDKLGTLAAVGAIYLVAVVVIALVVGLVTGAGLFALMGGGDPSAGATAGAVMGMLLAVLLMLALLLPVFMAMWFAPALVVLQDARRGRRDEGELRRLPEEHRAVPDLRRGAVRRQHHRGDPARPGLPGAAAGGSPARSTPRTATSTSRRSRRSRRPAHSQARPASCTAHTMPSAQG